MMEHYESGAIILNYIDKTKPVRDEEDLHFEKMTLPHLAREAKDDDIKEIVESLNTLVDTERYQFDHITKTSNVTIA